jgi:hypothetical protein
MLGLMKRATANRGRAEEATKAGALVTLCGRVGDRLLVEVPSQGIIEARTTLHFSRKALAAAIKARRQAVLVICGDVAVVTGLLEPLPTNERNDADEEELVLNSAKGVVLRCGEASVRLTPDGRVVVRGKDVVSRAKRRNQISGGTVRLN